MELTRRQFFAQSAGALSALPLASCGSWLGPDHAELVQKIQGGFVGASHERGHLLRSADARSRPIEKRKRVDVLILGAGVAGLSAAWRLQRGGVTDFELLELENLPGGTSRAGSSPTINYPWGAHYLPVPSQDQPALCTLLRELGVLEGFDAAGRAICGEQHLCRAPQERIFYKGRWYEGLYLRAGASTEDLTQLDKFYDLVGRWVRAKAGSGRRAFTLPRQHADVRADGAAELDTLTLSALLSQQGLTSSRLRWYVDYACRDDFGVRATETSAWAGIHYYAARLLHPDDSAPEVLTWPEGNGWLVGGLARRVAERIRTGCVVLEVRRLPESGSDDRIEVLYQDQSAPGAAVLTSVTARKVIFALPTYLRRHLLPELREHPPEFLSQFTYAPWLVANLTLRRPPSPPVAPGLGSPTATAARGGDGYPLCWDNVLIESPALGYVVATHQREPAPPADGVPRTVFTYYLPLCDPERGPRGERERLLATPWSTFRDFILADLRRADPALLAQCERIDMMRWGHGMVRPVPGLQSSGALESAQQPLGDIHFAHSDLSGLSLFEEAHQHGVRAAEEVLRGFGHALVEW